MRGIYRLSDATVSFICELINKDRIDVTGREWRDLLNKRTRELSDVLEKCIEKRILERGAHAMNPTALARTAIVAVSHVVAENDRLRKALARFQSSAARAESGGGEYAVAW